MTKQEASPSGTDPKQPERTDWVQQTRARLSARGNGKPTTKAGAVRVLWPEIARALEKGQTLKTIRDWLEEEGLSLSYNQLTTYVGRIRRRKETLLVLLREALAY